MRQNGQKPAQLSARVDIALAEAFSDIADGRKKAGKIFEKFILDYLGKLSASLRLPLQFELAVTASPEQIADGQKIAVSIDGTPCRMPLSSAISEKADAPELAAAIADIILQNRSRLVSERLTEMLLENHWHSDRKYLDRESIRQAQAFLIQLVDRGFHIERGITNIPSREQFPSAFTEEAALFEAALSSIDTLSITVFLKDPDSLQKPSANDDSAIEEMIDLMKDGLFYELGTVLPAVRFEPDTTLPPHQFRLQLNDLPLLPVNGLKATEFLTNDTPDRLRLLGIDKSRSALNPANNNASAIIEDKSGKLSTFCRESGLTTWGPRGYLILALSAGIRHLAGSFINEELVQHNLNLLEEYSAELISAIREKFSTAQLTAIFRSLLDEEISIRNLRSILEALQCVEGSMQADLASNIIFYPPSQNIFLSTEERKFETLTAIDYANQVRESLKKYISHKYTRGQSTLAVYLLAPEVENLLRTAEDGLLTGEDHQKLMTAVAAEFRYMPPTAQQPVILTTGDIRRKMLKFVEIEVPQLAVLAYSELSPDMNIQPIARISLE